MYIVLLPAVVGLGYSISSFLLSVSGSFFPVLCLVCCYFVIVFALSLWCDSFGVVGCCTLKKAIQAQNDRSFFIVQSKTISPLSLLYKKTVFPLLLVVQWKKTIFPTFLNGFTLFGFSSLLMLIAVLAVVVLVLYILFRWFVVRFWFIFSCLVFEVLLFCCCFCIVFLMWLVRCCWFEYNKK